MKPYWSPARDDSTHVPYQELRVVGRWDSQIATAQLRVLEQGELTVAKIKVALGIDEDFYFGTLLHERNVWDTMQQFSTDPYIGLLPGARCSVSRH